MWHQLDIWLLLAGLGIFIYGIKLIEESVAKLSGRSFKRLVRTGTSTNLRAVFTGTVTTAILQSSAAVTFMVMAFVGAGIVSMEGALAVVLGSNIGTTATSWIVATVGFKLNMEELSLPFIGTGGLILIFLGHSPRYSQISHLLVGFGFLFLGLGHMKDSVSTFADGLDPLLFKDASAWAFVAIGLTLTALMQSSSATVAILLTALYAGVFDFREAAFAIIGSNVGSTVAVFLGSFRGTLIKKRLARAYLLFKVLAAILALSGFSFYLRMVAWILGEDFDPVLGLALFHTLFNLLAVAVAFPFLGRFSQLLTKIVKEKVEQRTRYIGQTEAGMPEAALASVQKEVHQFLLETLAFHLDLMEIETKLVLPTATQLMPRTAYGTYAEHYDDLKELQGEIIAFVTQVERQEMSEAESIALNKAIHSARMALYAAKSLKDVKNNIDTFEDASAFLEHYRDTLRKRVMATHMRIARLLDNGISKDPTSEIAALLRQLDLDDAQGMNEVDLAIRGGALKNLDLSTATLVNRAVMRSSHELVLAVAELILPKEEMQTLERLQEVEEAISRPVS